MCPHVDSPRLRESEPAVWWRISDGRYVTAPRLESRNSFGTEECRCCLSRKALNAPRTRPPTGLRALRCVPSGEWLCALPHRSSVGDRAAYRWTCAIGEVSPQVHYPSAARESPLRDQAGAQALDPKSDGRACSRLPGINDRAARRSPGRNGRWLGHAGASSVGLGSVRSVANPRQGILL